ncbi:hypothetical protein [Nocardiopsis sp. NRRL B-16309]|uniref:hypothetical protein n=1 Tax=Nocardiopsis sp. NRRL B-16309 TaxID=1519494 RepID=UPI0006C0E6D2|nr:hypothetical protein [Nocardiopsis sp. NRRL B-16309]KOX16479.1 hypothetical protein ADL05_12220 [Nocardiopsis sp. NRRL B-16309]
MAASDPKSRVVNAKIAAHWRWATTIDRSAATRPAREAAQRALEASVDPQGQMTPQQRAAAVKSLRSAKARQMAKARWDKKKREAG